MEPEKKDFAIKTLLLNKEIEKKNNAFDIASTSMPEVITSKQQPVEQIKEESIAKQDEPQYAKEKIIKPDRRFRLKVCFIAFALIFTICVGWSIGNAIAINNRAEQLNLAQTEYNLNLAQYAIKISNLDGVSIDDEDDEFSPVASFIELQPQPMKEGEIYKSNTNWFDKLCNWLSKIFGA